MATPPTKTATKMAVSPRSGAAIPVGAHPKNTGGKKGRSGRKSKAFLQRCFEASRDSELWEAARKKNPVAVLQLAAEFTATKPAQQHTVDSTVTFKAVRE